jgi:hypothetical protein
LEFLTRAVRKEKEIKRIQTGKEEVKLSLLAANMILYLKNLKNVTKLLLEIINTFGKVGRLKINTQKSFVFLHSKNEHIDKEFRESIPFAIASKNKILRKI